MQHNIPCDGKWLTVSDEQIADLRAKGKHPSADYFDHRIVEMQKNPLAYFLPHGVKWSKKERVFGNGALVLPPSDYDEKLKNDGVAFLDDRVHDFDLMLGPNQQGKTFLLAAWTGLRICKCEPSWPVFTEVGVKCPEWTGPKTYVIASYSWDNVGTIWDTIKAVFPRRELGQYSPNWGMFEGEKGRELPKTFGDGRRKVLDLKYSGSRLIFLCYTQQQMHWEGFHADGAALDEQAPREKVVGLIRGFTTSDDYSPIGMALTGHVMEDRPDTGAGGWIKTGLCDGGSSMGKTVGVYHLSVESTADVVVSPKRKKALYDQWVNPDVPRTEKDERAAVARYWGGWELGSGLVFENWDRSIHVIPPLWEDDQCPKNWTKWRVIDYGDTGITCCAWFAVGPTGLAVCYRLYYERGVLISESVADIIRLSHNEREEVGTDYDEVTGNTYKMYREIQSGEEFYSDILDGRSACSKQQGELILHVFSRYGLEGIQAANAQQYKNQNPRVREWLAIDWTKDHLTKRNDDGSRVKGMPCIVFFDGRTDQAVAEIESYRIDPKDPGKAARKQDDHFISTFRYWSSDDPRYWGDWKPGGEVQELKPTKYTGYQS